MCILDVGILYNLLIYVVIIKFDVIFLNLVDKLSNVYVYDYWILRVIINLVKIFSYLDEDLWFKVYVYVCIYRGF